MKHGTLTLVKRETWGLSVEQLLKVNKPGCQSGGTISGDGFGSAELCYKINEDGEGMLIAIELWVMVRSISKLFKRRIIDRLS